MTNLIVNPSNPKAYVQAFLDDELYFTFTPMLLQRQANIFWRKYNLQTDESLTPFKNIINETFFARTATDYRDLTLLGTDSDTIYAQFYLRRSTYTENIWRNYQKVDDLMSYLGGFLQIMIVFFGFFIQVYNKQSQLVDLSNELFDFDIQDEEITKKTVQSNFEESQQQLFNQVQQQSMISLGCEISNIQLEKDQITISNQQKKCNSTQEIFLHNFNSKINNQESQKKMFCSQQLENKHKNEIEKNKQKSGELYFFEQIQTLLGNNKKIQFSFKYFFKKMFCKKLLKSQNEQLLNRAVNQIQSELDLVDILNKIQELDKLKELLLKKPQQIIFNFSPKPLISLNEKKIFPSSQKNNQFSLENQQKFLNDIESKFQFDNGSANQILQKYSSVLDLNGYRIYYKLFKAYEKIILELEEQSEDNKMNLQLIKYLGPQIQNIFEVTQLLQKYQRIQKLNEVTQVQYLFKND